MKFTVRIPVTTSSDPRQLEELLTNLIAANMTAIYVGLVAMAQANGKVTPHVEAEIRRQTVEMAERLFPGVDVGDE